MGLLRWLFNPIILLFNWLFVTKTEPINPVEEKEPYKPRYDAPRYDKPTYKPSRYEEPVKRKYESPKQDDSLLENVATIIALDYMFSDNSSSSSSDYSDSSSSNDGFDCGFGGGDYSGGGSGGDF